MTAPMNNPQLAPEAGALLPCPLCGQQLQPAADHRMAGMLEHPAGLPLCPISALCFNDTPEMRALWNRRAPVSTGAVAPEPGEPGPIFLPGQFGHRLLQIAERFVAEYAFDDGETVYHTPTEEEQVLLLDCVNGIFGDEEFSAILQSLHPAPADTGQGGRGTVTVHHHPDNKPSPALDAIVSAAVQQFTAEPPWTMRLAHVEQRTAIERQASDLKGAIEALGGHPLLTDALRATDLTMRTLGKWHDAGEPGAALDAGART